ncbi:unnamed protein product [Ilex paraguariensis]|uniref:Cell number regulator 8 n=1 Tax=Ilex paraguariensis TaxID=185542 RepID=A0ABC8T5W9_9AQUA
MANSEESSPLLAKQPEVNDEKKSTKHATTTPPPAVVVMKKSPPQVPGEAPYGWTADGLPFGHANVVGQPMPRAHWDSSLFACLGRNDEFCSSDLEICIPIIVGVGEFPVSLPGSCEAFGRSCGCCTSFVEDEEQREQCESACDCATHWFCHPCALCQEAR